MSDQRTEVDQLSAPLPEYFLATVDGPDWIMKCKVCGKRWRLVRPPPGHQGHAGNVLALLNHAYSHLPTEDDEDEDD